MTGRPFLAPPAGDVAPVPAPSFSIIIPVYNGAATIGRAIASALDQTVRALEVVVVDDGSTDDLDTALDPYEGKITLLRKPNGGGASAFNAGVRAASGDFVAMLDADDAYERERIEALAELGAARPDLDLLATDLYLEIDGRIEGRFSTTTPFVVDDQRAGIFDRCFVLAPAIRRERLLAIGGQDEALRIGYDWDCYLRLILGGSKAGVVDVPLYRYRFAPESLTGDRPAALRARVTMLTKATRNPDLRPDEREALERAITLNTRRALLSEAEAALRGGEVDARRRALAVAARARLRRAHAREGAGGRRAPPLGRPPPRPARGTRRKVTPDQEPRLVTEWIAPRPAGHVEPAATPSFSVIIAAYEAAETVGEAIESALSQTLPPLEVVVCDDGSTDDIAGAVAPYERDIVFLRQENGGEASAKNAAARAASGEYVVILDADDLYLPGRLEALAELARARPDLDILTTDALIEVDGAVIRRCYTGSFRFEADDQRRAILRENFIFGHVAVRREPLLAAGGYDEAIRWTTDWDCWLRMILGGSRAGLVTEPLSRYRVQSGSLSSQRESHIAGRLQTLEKAQRRTDLSDAERTVVRSSISANQVAHREARARAALLESRPDARRRALAVSLGGGHGVRTRIKALAAAVAPASARRRLARDPRETTAGIRVP